MTSMVARLPDEVFEIVAAVRAHTGANLGIHCHNDAGVAVSQFDGCGTAGYKFEDTIALASDVAMPNLITLI